MPVPTVKFKNIPNPRIIIRATGAGDPDVYKCVIMRPTTWVKLSA